MYNLTESQKSPLLLIVNHVRNENLSEEFEITWDFDRVMAIRHSKQGIKDDLRHFTNIGLTALTRDGFLVCSQNDSDGQSTKSKTFALTQKAYEAVDSNFDVPDTSFIKYLTPLADVSGFDKELQERCLPILGAGNDPKHWDSAVRQAFLILEERLRSVSGLPSSDKNTSENLVNKIFGEGTSLIKENKERTSYRNLFSGMFTVFRNEYGHRFVDPSPEDGGAIITFINLLLKMLEELRSSPSS